ncbi:MAG: DUF937 domain-containing protein [Cytophagaceae bacterium]|jgi:hypothetical protein|nr:DUF937 domain-containing protein [Cytophagaceae bacterium]
MLENLLNLVKETGSDYVNSDNGLDNKHSDEAMKMASSSIMDVLGQQLNGGNAQNVMSLLSGNTNTQGNPVVNMIIQQLSGNIMQKFGIGSAQASGIATTLIPMVLNQFIKKTNDPNDSSFDLQSIAGTLLNQGGQGGGMNVSSLMNLIGGNNSGNNNSNPGGDLLNSITKLF